MVVDTALQRRENEGGYNNNNNNNSDDGTTGAGPRLPFAMLAQIQTMDGSTTTTPSDAAIVDMLPLPSAEMVWTVSHGSPNAIQGWKLVRDSESGDLLPVASHTPRPNGIGIETIHASPIVAMKAIPKNRGDDCDCDDGGTSLVVSVSDNGQIVVWEATAATGSVSIRLRSNLFREQQQEDFYDENDSVLSMDVDDQYLYLGSKTGRISILSLEPVVTEGESTGEIGSLPLVKSFVGFTSRSPGVSSLLAAGPGTLGGSSSNNNSNMNGRPPTKSLIAGNTIGGLKQWELIPSGQGRLEYWPRMASQKLPGGKPHVYETREGCYPGDNEDDCEGEGETSSAIRELVCIQQVLLAATDHDLTVWDSLTGKALYDMQGLDFGFAGSNPGGHHRPSLIVANDSVLVTNGMENFVCVHDFTMDRITSENAQDFLERDSDGGDSDGSGDS